MDKELNDTREWVIENAKSQIKHYQDLIEKTEDEIKKSEWMNGKDEMELQTRFKKDLSIHCNDPNWTVSKERSDTISNTPFFIDVVDNRDGNRIFLGLTTSDAKKLRDYLNQKIEYLES